MPTVALRGRVHRDQRVLDDVTDILCIDGNRRTGVC
jgi:hypothetical protein